MTIERKEYTYATKELLDRNDDIWINPIGGYGDIIMTSTALNKAFQFHGRKFKMVRRSQYTPLFKGHPAIESFGFPPKGSIIIGTDYWSRPEFEDPHVRALEVLTKIFGGIPDQDQTLFLPESNEDKNEVLMESIPWSQNTVTISPVSESIRKMMHPMKWHKIVEILRQRNYFVIQVGKATDIPIKGAYSLLGTTSPWQVLEILKKSSFVITLDNFIMHAAQLQSISTISLFGPTYSSQYGYSNQICLQADTEFCPHKDHCLGVRTPGNYTNPCPMNEKHCMNQFSEHQITDIIFSKKN